MDRRQFVVSALAGVTVLTAARASALAQASSRPDLAALAGANALKLFNRTAERLTDGSRTGVRLSAAPGDGIALVPDVEFGDGTIAFDVRGKDVPQQSFVGVAFHAVDRSTYDVIYFRPFNFRAPQPLNRSHGVQYHSIPGYGWEKLRTEQPGKYEHDVAPAPDPNAWFHARVVIAGPALRVFVGDASEPCLSVSLLGKQRTGLVGLWVGNNSGGDFANLTLTPASS